MDLNLETCGRGILIGVAIYLLVIRVFNIEGLYNKSTGDGINPVCSEIAYLNECSLGSEIRCRNMRSIGPAGPGKGVPACNINKDQCDDDRNTDLVWCGNDWGQSPGPNLCTPNSEGRCPFIEETCPDAVPSPAVKNEHGQIITGGIARCCETYLNDDMCKLCINQSGCDVPPPPPPPPPPPQPRTTSLPLRSGKQLGECCTLNFPYVYDNFSDCAGDLICTRNQRNASVSVNIIEKCNPLGSIDFTKGICAHNYG